MIEQRKRHRRGNGEGSVFQRKDGRWAATITAGYSETGKRKRRTVYAQTKRDVLDKLRALSNDQAAGILTEPTTATVADYLRDWLKNSAKPAIRESTYRNYQNSVERHIIPVIGGMRLKRLAPSHLQGLYAALLERGLTPKTIRTSYIILRKALTQAERWGLITRDPSRDVKPPAIPHREMQVLTAGQVQEFLKTAQSERLYALFYVATMTGMRLGELCGLQWQDVDFDGKRLSVVRTVTEIRGKQVIDAPKTKRSRRTIDLSASVVEVLHEHRKALMREGLGGCDWVFPSAAGTPLRRTNIHAHGFKRTLTAAGLPSIRFHDLRHTHATLLLQQGVSPKIVAERMGHASVVITLDVYSHAVPGMQADAASRLDELLSSHKGCQLAVNKA